MDKCKELAEELLEALEEEKAPRHLIEQASGLIEDIELADESDGDLNEPMEDESDEEEKGPMENEDDGEETEENELDKFAKKEVEKKTGKPMLMIHIKTKK